MEMEAKFFFLTCADLATQSLKDYDHLFRSVLSTTLLHRCIERRKPYVRYEFRNFPEKGRSQVVVVV